MGPLEVYAFLFLFLGASAGFAKSNEEPEYSSHSNNNYGIMGSNVTKIRKHPYTVSVIYHSGVSYEELRGGGAILNKRWVLCSASQLKTFEDNLTVRAGSSLSFAGGQSIKVDKLIMHESYVYGFDFNIAMLKLARALKFNRNTKPIRLARFRPKDGAIAVVSGFGMRNLSVSGQGFVQAATTQVKSQADCLESHSSDVIDNKSFCAHRDKSGPCNGDYGDPLVHKRKLVGIFVGGDLCNFFNSLEVYCSIGYYRQWILSTMKNN